MNSAVQNAGSLQNGPTPGFEGTGKVWLFSRGALAAVRGVCVWRCLFVLTAGENNNSFLC